MTEPEPTARAGIQRMVAITRTDVGRKDVVVIGVSGELDLLTTQELEKQLSSALAPPNRVVVVDLSEVRFLGSAALSALLSSAESAGSNGIEFKLVAADRATLRPMEVTGISSNLTIFGSVDEALAGLG